MTWQGKCLTIEMPKGDVSIAKHNEAKHTTVCFLCTYDLEESLHLCCENCLVVVRGKSLGNCCARWLAQSRCQGLSEMNWSV